MTSNYANGIIILMTPEELLRLRKKLDLTQAQMADKIGITSNALARLERGERKISEPISRLVKLLVEIELKDSRKDR